MTLVAGASDLSALIVGLGSIGTRHLGNLRALGIKNLSVLRTGTTSPANSVDLRGVTLYHDYEEALAGAPDLVIVANPTSLHAETAARAMAAGAHVYIEKPIATDERAAQILRDVKRPGKVYMVGCQLRFDPCLQAVFRWLASDRMGKVFTVSSDVGEYLPDWHPWEDYRKSYAARSDLGGGVVLTLIHEIDYLLWLLGPVQSLFAVGGHLTPLQIDVDDTVIALLKTTGGALIQLRLDYWRRPPARTLQVVAEKGQIDWDYHSGQAILRDRDGGVDIVKIPDGWQRNDLFLAAMTDFIRAVVENRESVVSLQHGIEALRTADAILQSVRTRQQVELR